jgi:hypothetical protein
VKHNALPLSAPWHELYNPKDDRVTESCGRPCSTPPPPNHPCPPSPKTGSLVLNLLCSIHATTNLHLVPRVAWSSLSTASQSMSSVTNMSISVGLTAVSSSLRLTSAALGVPLLTQKSRQTQCTVERATPIKLQISSGP